jgi:hypothetical protein
MRPLFSQTYKSLFAPVRLSRPLYSYTYKPLGAQLLCLHIYTKRPGVTLTFCDRNSFVMTHDIFQQVALESTLAKVYQNKPLQLPLE